MNTPKDQMKRWYKLLQYEIEWLFWIIASPNSLKPIGLLSDSRCNRSVVIPNKVCKPENEQSARVPAEDSLHDLATATPMYWKSIEIRRGGCQATSEHKS